MESLFYPLGSLQEVYCLLYLSQTFDLEIEFESLTSVFNNCLNTSYDSNILKLGSKILKL